MKMDKLLASVIPADLREKAEGFITFVSSFLNETKTKLDETNTRLNNLEAASKRIEEALVRLESLPNLTIQSATEAEHDGRNGHG
jgi:hypothetical protein